MKKIYIFTAVLALLTLSLNAQLKSHKNVVAKSTTTTTGKVDIRPDAFFRMGPSRASTVPVTPPYSNGFDSSDEWNWWETIDVDGDGSSNGNGQWTLYNNQARYLYHSTDAANDWLVTAPITLKAGKSYKVSFDATAGSSFSERLEVKLASSNTASALSSGTTVIESTTFKGSRAFSNENVTVDTDGNYYIGIHAISDADMYNLYVDNFNIDVEITDPTIQTSASSVTMNSIPGGTETQTVTVTGLYLTDNITTSIGGTNAAMFSVSPASLGNSGGELTISYTPTAVGSHTATLTLSSTDADDVTVTLNGTATNDLTICDGTNSNYHLPIYGNYAEQLQINQMIYPEITSLIGKDITSMTFYVDGTLNSKLGDDTWVVKLGTTNQTGYTTRTRLVTDDIQEVYSGYLTTGSNTLTITFDTPFTYNGGNLLVDFEETTTSGDFSSTTFFGVSQSDDTGFYSYNNNASGGLESFLPKVTFTFEDSEPRHDLAIALTEPDAVVAGETATITATVTNKGNQTETGYTVTITVDGTPTTLTGGTLAPNATETFTIQYPTTAAQGGNTVSVAANVACTDDANLNDNDATASLQVNAQVQDLAIALNAPASVVGGNSATVTATVTNTGNQPMTGYTVTITDGTNNLLNQTATEPLAPGATATYSAEYNTTAAQVGNTVNFAANVTCADDADATNNSATASMQIITMPAPENVAVTTGSNQSATMTWDAPSIESTSQTVEWDFEEEADFNAFTIVDADGDNHNWYYSNSEDEVTHSGTGGVTSESYVNNASGSGGTALDPDNWLISPEITLGGNLSFWVAGQDPDWPSENFAVYVCEGPYSSTSDFVKIGDYTATATMSEILVDLSQYEGQGYFAIRHYNMTGNDMFRLNIDDISYSTREDAIFPVSYNIYLDGELVGNVDANTFSYTFNNVSGEHECAVSAVYPGGIESAAVPATFTIQAQTSAPTIAISSQTDNQVTITATGNGTVTLTIDGQTVEGNGSASITVPRQMQDYVVSATATAQASGELVSEPTTQNLTIPGMASSGEWTEMVGTYNNPNDLLSFQVKVGNDTTDIMLIDQFWAPTVHNDHPNGYTYVLKETIDGEEKSSNPATVPVYKTNSNLNGLYTEAQVIADNKYDENKLTAHTLNTQIEYDVVPDNNVLYYSLYRGEKNEQRPVIDVDHRISQLQKFEDKVDGNVMYYFNENHQQGVLPKYEHIGSQTAERLDMNYVTGTGEDELSYVPVIWTFGLYTARGDGKNNSYGSDIKHSYVGKVNISVEGLKNDGDYTTGQWKDPNGTTYCVYSPIITLGGVTPDDGGANDGDTYQYVPYMYRVWCTYPNAHNFTLLANPDGKVHLADAGAITAPFLIGEVTAEDTEAWNGTGEEVKIGRALESGEAQQPWSFGVPVNESSSNVQFVARFYYKKIVTPAVQVNGLRGTRDNDEAAFAIAENSDDGEGIVTGINELADIVYVVSTTYVNAQGMQSDKPFDGLNIVVTRYSDGTTRTTKLVR